METNFKKNKNLWSFLKTYFLIEPVQSRVYGTFIYKMTSVAQHWFEWRHFRQIVWLTCYSFYRTAYPEYDHVYLIHYYFYYLVYIIILCVYGIKIY